MAFTSLRASNWTGATASWGGNANPGWNGTGVPNAQGAIANFGADAIVSGTTTQDTGASVTVGTISFSAGNANVRRSITNTNGITLNEDGAGAGSATISNTNTNAGSTNQLLITGGTLTLTDNLLISNSGGSMSGSGAIQIDSAIAGTGNLTFSNVSTALSSTGSIRLERSSSFAGSSLIQKGTVAFTQGNAFGTSTTNVISLGQSGQGDAALLSAASVTMARNVTVASGTNGTSTLGSVSTTTSGNTFSGTISLDGNVNLLSASPVGNTEVLTFSGRITGSGTVQASASGSSPVAVRLTGNNDYTGTTTINNNVTLRAAGTVSNQSLGGTNGITINSGGTLLLGASNQINNNAGVALNGGGTFNSGGFTEGTRPSSPSAIDGAAGIGALTLQNTTTSLRAIIDFTSGNSSTLAFSSLAGASGAFVNVLNWTGTTNTDNGSATNDRLLFANDPMLSTTDLANWTFFNDSGSPFATGAMIIAYGNEFEMVPIPEPGTWAAAAFAAAVLGYEFARPRRRRDIG